MDYDQKKREKERQRSFYYLFLKTIVDWVGRVGVEVDVAIVYWNEIPSEVSILKSELIPLIS